MNTQVDLYKQPRVELSKFPTPMEYAKNLTRYLGGPQIYIKRDDVTSLAFGGNKTRKLEYIMADVLKQGADTVVTLGGVQSNWIRQTIAASKRLGLHTVSVFENSEPEVYQGNFLLDKLMGSGMRFYPDITQEIEDAEIAGEFPITGQIARELKKEGRHPYLLPLGGTSPEGNLGYIMAVDEIYKQMDDIGTSASHIIAATGTGGTQTGLECGIRVFGLRTKMVGISISRHTRPKELEIAEMCNKTIDHFKLPITPFSELDILVNYDYVGEKYGAFTHAADEAVRIAAELEGIILCHTYAGKAMAGLINLSRSGYFTKRDTVVFIHTGGGVANFAFPERFHAYAKS